MKGGPPRVTDERGNGKAHAAVVGHLSLELLERPAARGGQAPELVCERLPESRRVSLGTGIRHENRASALSLGSDT
jgi:hypothetical protein